MRFFPSFAIRLAVALLACLLFPASAPANDAAVETAAGGIQLRTEQRICLSKERLYIGKHFTGRDPSNLPVLQNKYRVVVDYEFVNESDKDVTTEVAFPLTELRYQPFDLISDRKVGGFKVEVDGKDQPYTTLVRAKAKGRDITDLLRRYDIGIESFGNFDDSVSGKGPYRVESLPPEAQARLRAAGAVNRDLTPNWSVSVTYLWKQTFRAGKVVRVRHEYDAVPGFSYFPMAHETKRFSLGGYLSGLKSGCFEKGLEGELRTARERLPEPGGDVLVGTEWVKYILTTAKTWKMPIRDFELVVEAPAGNFVRFCWNGKMEKLSNNRFRATAKDFIPSRELLIYFLSVEPVPGE